MKQWIEAELARAYGPRKIVRLFRADPSLWLWLIVVYGATFAVYWVILAASGKLDDFSTWLFLPTLIATSAFEAPLQSSLRRHKL